MSEIIINGNNNISNLVLFSENSNLNSQSNNTNNTNNTNNNINNSNNTNNTNNKLKILCLHGGRETVNSFKYQLGMHHLINDLSNNYEFIFITAPNDNNLWINDGKL